MAAGHGSLGLSHLSHLSGSGISLGPGQGLDTAPDIWALLSGHCNGDMDSQDRAITEASGTASVKGGGAGSVRPGVPSVPTWYNTVQNLIMTDSSFTVRIKVRRTR